MLKFEIKKKIQDLEKKNKWTKKLLKWSMFCEVVNNSKSIKKYF